MSLLRSGKGMALKQRVEEAVEAAEAANNSHEAGPVDKRKKGAMTQAAVGDCLKDLK